MTSPPTIVFPSPNAPPISAGWVTVSPDGHLACNGQRYVAFGVNIDYWAMATPLVWNGKAMALDAGLCDQVRWHFDNLVNAGVRAVRIHNLDIGTGSNIFCAGNGPMTTTRHLDFASMQALCFFWSECRKRNLRIVLTLHNQRRLQATDVVLSMTAGANEAVALNHGYLMPHGWFSVPIQALFDEFNQQILRWINPYTGIALGDDPTLLAVTLQNEHSLCKDGDPMALSGWPVYCQLANTSAEAYRAWNGIPLNKTNPALSLNKTQRQQWMANVETSVLSAQAASVRQWTKALVIGGTYYGAAPYASIVGPHAVGDVDDFHFYSRYAPGESNGFGAGPSGLGARSRFAAVAAGCSWGKPTFCTEWAPVGQFNPLTRDPDIERAGLMKAVVEAAVAQDLDAMFLYSWGWHSFLPDNSPAAKTGVYDFRNDAVLLRGLQPHAAWFQDVSCRPTTSVSIPLSDADVYGSGTGPAYVQHGPYSDDRLYAQPASVKIAMVRG